jgi:ankyrin repeat protein
MTLFVGCGKSPLSRLEVENICEAAELGALTEVQKLAGQAKSVDVRCEFGETPLHRAARRGHLEIVESLLTHGAAPLTPSRNKGNTALHFAATHDEAQVLEKLLAAGGDPEFHNQDGATPLHLAAANNAMNALKVLLAHGVDLTARSKSDYRYVPTGEDLRRGLDKVIPQPENKFEAWTALHWAARYGKLEAALALIKAGAATNITDHYGNTPLHLVIVYAQRDRRGNVKDRAIELIEKLTAHSDGAMMKENYDGWTPLDAARARKLPEELISKINRATWR